MKHRILMAGVLTLALAACGGDGDDGADNMQEAGATADVVAATAGSDMATAVDDAAEEMDEVAEDIEDRLSAQVWGWSASTGGDGTSTMVDDKEKYKLTFIPGTGTVAIDADCKQAGGTYTADDNRLIFDLEVTETDSCGAGSMADAFLEQLQKADSYVVDEGTLTISLTDGGTMLFED